MSRLPRSGWKLPQLTLHHFDFLQLFDNYALSKPAQDSVLAELQFDLCHVDSTLVMGDHHRSEVTIRITARDNAHISVHVFHGLHHQGCKKVGRNAGRRQALRWRDFMLMRRLSSGYRNYEEDGQSYGSCFSRLHLITPLPDTMVHGSAPADCQGLRLIVGIEHCRCLFQRRLAHALRDFDPTHDFFGSNQVLRPWRSGGFQSGSIRPGTNDRYWKG